MVNVQSEPGALGEPEKWKVGLLPPASKMSPVTLPPSI